MNKSKITENCRKAPREAALENRQKYEEQEK